MVTLQEHYTCCHLAQCSAQVYALELGASALCHYCQHESNLYVTLDTLCDVVIIIEMHAMQVVKH